jgi:hypothetical protein
MSPRRVLLAAVVAALVAATPLATADEPSDWSDPAYRAHDLDNIQRAEGRRIRDLSDPGWHEAMWGAGTQSWFEAQGEQLADLPHGRVRTGAGQIGPGGTAGDPRTYTPAEATEVFFLSRTGAKLDGHVWGAGGAGRPGVVITTGSIQVPEASYWWLARQLAAAGYQVLTFDVQGQGESEGFGQSSPEGRSPTFEGFPSQQAANFVDGTVDALRFLLSTPEAPYGTADARQGIDGFNPHHGALDPARVGIIGHSLGASAVGQVQQCSDEAALWQTLAVCGGRSFPIRAVIGYDVLPSAVTPVVPAMDQQGDGYFINPQPTYRAPDPTAHLGAFRKWRDAGLDVFAFSIRGGTHSEWSYIPYLTGATTYGQEMIAHYTLAWLDRWVHADGARRAAAQAALTQPAHGSWFSARYLSSSFLGGVEVADLRAAAGRSPVGDWEGANADTAGSVSATG